MSSYRAQLLHLRRAAVQALGAYPLSDPIVQFIGHGENTTFKVTARTEAGSVERFLLRVHRPSRHGRFVDSGAAIDSELRWLMALRAETDLAVPRPLPTRNGELTMTAETRICSVLHWMDGRRHSRSPRPGHLRLLGNAMARLHDHADTWTRPTDFVRIRWDWETFFGDTMQYGGINAAQVWDLLPDGLRRTFDRVAKSARRAMSTLGDGPDAFGLVHADLHLDNALFTGGEVKLIDFDDSGTGYRIYDLAVALWELRHRPDYEQFRTALIDGYSAQRALPAAQLDHLDTFIAVREVAFGLWFVGTAQVNPVFHSRLPRELAGIERSLATLLPCAERSCRGSPLGWKWGLLSAVDLPETYIRCARERDSRG
ncbi:phosphotransferase enzyme family protein [Kutzneria buriramensis]|nr:phosphotransferase [Kutzneria buriramensis]